MTEFSYLNISQWLLYGGKVTFGSVGDNTKIDATILDPGGCAPGWSSTFSSFEDALGWAEKKVGEIIRSNEKVLELHRSGELPWGGEEIIRLPGLPPVKNPNFNNKSG